MNAQQLADLGIDSQWLDALNATFDRFAINTPQRQACFIGQCAHESAGFKVLSENLNYSAKGLRATWPKRFPDDASAAALQRQPERIANRVYAGRMGKRSGARFRRHTATSRVGLPTPRAEQDVAESVRSGTSAPRTYPLVRATE